MRSLFQFWSKIPEIGIPGFFEHVTAEVRRVDLFPCVVSIIFWQNRAMSTKNAHRFIFFFGIHYRSKNAFANVCSAKFRPKQCVQKRLQPKILSEKTVSKHLKRKVLARKCVRKLMQPKILAENRGIFTQVRRAVRAKPLQNSCKLGRRASREC